MSLLGLNGYKEPSQDWTLQRNSYNVNIQQIIQCPKSNSETTIMFYQKLTC